MIRGRRRRAGATTEERVAGALAGRNQKRSLARVAGVATAGKKNGKIIASSGNPRRALGATKTRTIGEETLRTTVTIGRAESLRTASAGTRALLPSAAGMRTRT